MLVYQRVACKKKLSPWEDSHWLPKLLALPERDGGRCGLGGSSGRLLRKIENSTSSKRCQETNFSLHDLDQHIRHFAEISVTIRSFDRMMTRHISVFLHSKGSPLTISQAKRLTVSRFHTGAPLHTGPLDHWTCSARCAEIRQVVVRVFSWKAT